MSHIHAERIARSLERAAFVDECAELAPELIRIATKHGRSPHTVAKIAFAHTRSLAEHGRKA